MVRSQCCEKEGLKKGPWTPEEDQKLLAYIQKHGHGSWRALPTKAGLQRCGKSCRLRWTNYLRPDIKRGKFSLQEEQTIIQLHALLGNRWSAIATHLPKRTDNEIKNYWNTHLKKRLDKMGIDPVTHKPKTNAFGSGGGHPKDAANLSHMAQWESARLEAEARLVRESKLICTNTNNPPQNQLAGASAASTAQLTTKAPPARPQCLDVLKAWQGVVFSMFSVATDCLESPTSTLNFPANTLPIVPPVNGVLHQNTSNGRLEFATNNNNRNNVKSKGSAFSDWDCFEKLNQLAPLEVKERLLDSNSSMAAAFHEMSSTYSNESAWLVESSLPAAAASASASAAAAAAAAAAPENDENAGIGNMMEEEGFSDTLVCSTDDAHDIGQLVGENKNNNNGNGGSCGGNLEENRNYWNSLLNLLDLSPSGSHVF